VGRSSSRLIVAEWLLLGRVVLLGVPRKQAVIVQHELEAALRAHAGDGILLLGRGDVAYL
jgi:hypothetical protein